MGKLFVFLAILATNVPAFADQCYSSNGGNGSEWLSGQVTAGGSGAADVQVSLEPRQWRSGYSYCYESTCTNSRGNYSFRTETNPASSCYSTSTYYYGGTSYTYCNWRSCQCHEQCISDNLNGWYSSQVFSKSSYKVSARPVYNSSLGELYGNAEANLDADILGTAQTKDVSLVELNKIVRVRVVDDSGAAITSGLTIYLSGESLWRSSNLNASFRDFYTSAAASCSTYYVSAWASDYQSSDYTCITNKNVSVCPTDSIKEVTLTAKRKNATVNFRVSGSDGSAISNAYVSVNSSTSGAEGCYSYASCQTASDGTCSSSAPAGNYSLWVSPPYTGSVNTYSSAQSSISLIANQTVQKDITLQAKNSTITGRVRDSNDNPLQDAWCSAWAYSSNFHDWGSDQTDANGNYSISTVSGRRYNVNCSYWNSNSGSGSQTIASQSAEGMVTADAPVADLNFTFRLYDHAVTFSLRDASDNAVSNFYGGASIFPQNRSGSRDSWWGSEWLSFNGGSAQKNLSSNFDYRLQLWAWGSGDYDPEETEHEFTTGERSGSSVVAIPLVPRDVTISGNFVDENDVVISPESRWLSVYATKGNLWREATATDTSYTLAASAGRWCVGYWADWMSGVASLPPGLSTQCLDVAAASTNTLDLEFRRVGFISFKVERQNGDPMQWVWCEASPYSAVDEGADEDRRQFWGNGCSSDSEGRCTIRVGAVSTGTPYYVTCHRPWYEMDEAGITPPTEAAATVFPGETADAGTLVWRLLDGELSVVTIVSSEAAAAASLSKQVVVNAQTALSEDIIKGVVLSGYSETGGITEGKTDDLGKATVRCASGDVWHIVGINQIGQELYLSEDAEATCQRLDLIGPTEVTVKMNYVKTLCESVTQTWDASVANSLADCDGASITYPALSLAESGSVSCTLQPDPVLPYQPGRRPTCFHGYDITCNKMNDDGSTGEAITSLLSPATIRLPICTEQLEILDLTSGDIDLAYRDVATDSYRNLTACTVDAAAGFISCQVDHLTEFVLVGNGNRSGVDGDTEDALEEADRTGEPATGEAGGGCGCRIGSAPASASVLGMSLGLSLALFIFCRVLGSWKWKRVRSRE